MPQSTSRAQQFQELATRGDHAGFEELWLETMDQAPSDVGAFLTGVESLESQGNFDKAGLYLTMLSPLLLELDLPREALRILRKMAAIAPGERGLRHGLLTAYRKLHPDHPRLESLLELSGIAEGKDIKEAVDRMDTFLGFAEGRYVFHPGGWNAGRVVEVDPVDGSLVIDFEEKRGHRISMEMAAKKTEFIHQDDIRAMKLDRMDRLKAIAEEDPVELVRCALRSRRGKGTLRDIKDRLAGDDARSVIPLKSWARWWSKTRSQVKAASDITITPGSNPTLELGEAGGSYADACLRDLRILTGGTRQIRYFRDLMKEALAHDDGDEAIINVANVLIADADSFSVGEQISLAFLLAEAQERWPAVTAPAELAPKHVLSDPQAILETLKDIPVSSHGVSAMLVLKETPGIRWLDFCAQVIKVGAPEPADHALHELVRAGATNLVRDTIDTVADRYRDNPRAFVWYLKAARSDKLPASVRRESDSVLLEKALVLHAHLAVAGIEKDLESEERLLGKELAKVFTARDYGIVRDAFTIATESESSNLAALLRNNRSLNADLRDRMMAHMFRTRPEAARAHPTEAHKVQDPLFDTGILYTTARSLLRKREEYERIVNHEIPENSVEIGRAASYGDLSENSEWTAAIEKQERLSKLADELKDGIGKARIIDNNLQHESDGVTLGSRITVTDSMGKDAEYTVLGPWDVDATRGFISYLSPLGMALIGNKVGDTIEVEVPSGRIAYVIKSLADGLADAETTPSASSSSSF
jgi:transcription elongation factor GreA